MADDIKFSEVDPADDITDVDWFVGVRIGVPANNYRYSLQQIADAIRIPPITVGSGGYSVSVDAKTLTGPALTKPIKSFLADRQVNIKNVDFTQDTDAGTVTGQNGVEFYNGQIIILER